MTEKTDKPPRQITVYQINSGTRVEIAAAKIIDKFGKDYARELAEAIMEATR